MPTYWCSAYGWWICPLFMVTFIIVFVIAVRLRNGALCFGPFGRRAPAGSAPPEHPKDILDRRYASGEITRQEYEEKLRDIQRS